MAKIVDFKILEKKSKKGKTYKGLFAITDTGKEIFVVFVNDSML